MEAEYRKAQERAIRKVEAAVYRDDLPRLSKVRVLCAECGKRRASHYEHRDYGKPLKVRPVCAKCNYVLGHAKVSPQVVDRPRPGHVCKHCGHKWERRQIIKPLACPRCKSYAWDKDKRRTRHAS